MLDLLLRKKEVLQNFINDSFFKSYKSEPERDGFI